MVTLLITFGVPHVDPDVVSTLNAAIVAFAALIVSLRVALVATLNAAKRKPAPVPSSPPAA